jgi:hypothetical protein
MHRHGASLNAVMNHTTADAIPSPKAHGRSLIVTGRQCRRRPGEPELGYLVAAFRSGRHRHPG